MSKSTPRFHRGRLQSLLIQLIGRRASVYTLLEELVARRHLQPCERTEDRIRVYKIYEKLFRDICDAERALEEMALELYPDFELPGGAGYFELPVVGTFESDGTGRYYQPDHKGENG